MTFTGSSNDGPLDEREFIEYHVELQFNQKVSVIVTEETKKVKEEAKILDLFEFNGIALLYGDSGILYDGVVYSSPNELLQHFDDLLTKPNITLPTHFNNKMLQYIVYQNGFKIQCEDKIYSSFSELIQSHN